MVARIISNHITILQKQKDAQELEVVDLSKGLAKDDPSVIILSDDSGFVNPYASASAVPQANEYVAPLSPTAGAAPQVMVAGMPPEPQVMTAGAPPPADAYSQMPQQRYDDPSAPSAPSAPAGW